MRIVRTRFLLLHLLITVTAAVPATAEPIGTTSLLGTCTPDAETLCLLSGRFAVTVDWDDTMSTGQGQSIPFSDSTGSYYFHDSRYVDLHVTMFDGCALNSRFWVFAKGLSDDIQTITITDTVTAEVKTYDNALGEYPTFTDVDAITCATRLAEPDSRPVATSGKSVAPVLSLADGRFAAELTWQDVMMTIGEGQPQPITSHSGTFGLFSATGTEVVVKVFDGTAVNGSFWVFFADTTDVEYTLTVTDSCDGSFQTYVQPLGSQPTTTVDTTAFGPDCALFADGFESGNTTSWDLAVP